MSLVAVLSNPQSTRNKKVMDRVRDVVERYSGVFHYEIENVSDIPAALDHFAGFGANILVINGGDGTIQATFSSLFNNNPFPKIPRIVVLPAGRTNMIAEDLGAWIPKPDRVLDKLLADLKNNDLKDRTIKRNVLSVKGLPGQPEIYGMFFGTAGIVRGIELCRQKIYPVGLPNFLAHSLVIAVLAFSMLRGPKSSKNLFRTDPIRVKVNNKGAVIGTFTVVTITTLERLILGLRPFVKEGKGALKYVSVELRRGVLFKALFYAIIGRTRNRPGDGIVACNADQIRLRLNCPVTIDGELYATDEDQELTVTTLNSLEFIHLSGKPVAK